MNKKLKAKWVKALRSGKYKQGSGRLYDETTGRYCCLGVLCRLGGRTDMFLLSHELETNSLLPGNKWPDQESADLLAQMNDGTDDEGNKCRRYTFAKIADYIEENL